jgi:hypothetical protein
MKRLVTVMIALNFTSNSQAFDLETFLKDAKDKSSAAFSTSEEAIATIRANLPTTDQVANATNQVLDYGDSMLTVMGEYLPDPNDITEMVTKGIMNYSVGYRVGTITRLGNDGIFGESILGLATSGEGTMFLGEDSNIKEKVIEIPCDEDVPEKAQANSPQNDNNSKEKPPEGSKKVCTTKITINPWKFSYNIEREELHKKLQQATSRKVIVSYRQPLFQHNGIYQTPYMVTGVSELNLTVQPGFNCTDSRKWYGGRLVDGPNEAKTTMLGTIVKLAYQGDVINTWEILFQENKYGGDFHYLSVHDDEMISCLFKILSSGKPVELVYESLYWQPEYRGETRTNVKSVTILDPKKF